MYVHNNKLARILLKHTDTSLIGVWPLDRRAKMYAACVSYAARVRPSILSWFTNQWQFYIHVLAYYSDDDVGQTNTVHGQHNKLANHSVDLSSLIH